MKYFWIILLSLHAALPILAKNAFYTKLLQNPQKNYNCLILEQNSVRIFKGFETSDINEFKTFVRSVISAPSDMKLKISDSSKIVEIYAKTINVLETYTNSICNAKELVTPLSQTKRQQRADPEVVKIVDGGDQANRIDVVFMGDGYTASERDNFFNDIRRLTDDMFNGETFRSYLPLFNIWAIFVESNESGIGYNGAKDTAFGLYRSAGQLRGIFPSNAPAARQICQLTGPGGCDYPSLIGNDDYYGGLGGEFVISTKSNRTGTVVLRHEMGHNFVSVGEEYDDGSSYYGVNSAPSLQDVVTKWGHWLNGGGDVRQERAIYRLLEYPWTNLTEIEQIFSFTSDGLYSRWYLELSVSAAGEADSLEFTIDGEKLPWESRGSDDREFYDWAGETGFSEGQHTFSVRSKTASTNSDIPRMICSITLHEFGDEDQYHMDNDIVSAFATWSSSRRITYRPTNAGCLMRNMTHTGFCPVCKEGMWYQFLQRISLIDEVKVSRTPNEVKTKRVEVNTLKLGQLRAAGNEVEDESLEIRWYHGGQERPEFNDQFVIDAEIGVWSVVVRFLTSEVRHDPYGLLQDSERFTVTFPVNSTMSIDPHVDFS